MISNEEIVRFEPQKQAEISATIARMVENDYKARHLMLSDRGSVLLDREAIDIEAETNALRDL